MNTIPIPAIITMTIWLMIMMAMTITTTITINHTFHTMHLSTPQKKSSIYLLSWLNSTSVQTVALSTTSNTSIITSKLFNPSYNRNSKLTKQTIIYHNLSIWYLTYMGKLQVELYIHNIHCSEYSLVKSMDMKLVMINLIDAHDCMDVRTHTLWDGMVTEGDFGTEWPVNTSELISTVLVSDSVC